MISVNRLYFFTYAIVSITILRWVSANVGYWESIFNLRNEEGRGNDEIPIEWEQFTLPQAEFVVNGRIICQEDPEVIQTEFNSALTFVCINVLLKVTYL